MENEGIPYSIEECVKYKQIHLANADPYLQELFQWLINMAMVGEHAIREAEREMSRTIYKSNDPN